MASKAREQKSLNFKWESLSRYCDRCMSKSTYLSGGNGLLVASSELFNDSRVVSAIEFGTDQQVRDIRAEVHQFGVPLLKAIDD